MCVNGLGSFAPDAVAYGAARYRNAMQRLRQRIRHECVDVWRRATARRRIAMRHIRCD